MLGSRLTGLACGTVAWAVGICFSGICVVGHAQHGESDPLLKQERDSLKAVCGQCHNLEVVLSAPMSYATWHETVQTMIDRGAAATDDQLNDIMDYLHRTMTTLNVNTADADELATVLGLPDSQVKALVARRKARKFDDIADLKSVAGIDGATLDAKSRLLFFQ